MNSIPAVVMMLLIHPAAAVIIQSVILPATPIGLVAEAVTDTEVVLRWDRVGASDSAFTISRSKGGGAFMVLATLRGGYNLFIDTSCYPSTEYTYQVTAHSAAGSSAPTQPFNP